MEVLKRLWASFALWNTATLEEMNKPLYEQKWFVNLVTRLRKYEWFEKNIWGYSKSMEDFVRNPAEVLRDTTWPFCIKDVKPFCLIFLRLGYIPYDRQIVKEKNSVKLDVGRVWTYNRKVYSYDIGALSKWSTKYPNAHFSFQIALPAPYISCLIKWSADKYFQFGLGWGAQRDYTDPEKFNAVLCGKFRLVDFSKEYEWNKDTEIYGFYEGVS